MMIEELNLSPNEMKILFLVLIVFLVKLLRHKSRRAFITIDSESKEQRQEKETNTALKARYGAYIQSHGRYYN